MLFYLLCDSKRVLFLLGNFYFRSIHRRCSIRKSFFINFAKLTEKHLCQSLFFNKVAYQRRFLLLFDFRFFFFKPPTTVGSETPELNALDCQNYSKTVSCVGHTWTLHNKFKMVKLKIWISNILLRLQIPMF